MGMHQVERDVQRRDRFETTLLLAAVAAVLVFAITVPLDLDPSITSVMNSFGFTLPFLLVGAQLAYHALRMGLRHRAWGLVSLSMFSLAGSNLFYVSHSSSSLSLYFSDELWLLSFLPIVVGVTLLVRPLTRGEGWVSILDGAVVALGVFTVAIAVLSEVLEAAHGLPVSRALNANLLEVLADDVLLAVTLGAVHASKWRPPRWVWCVLAAAVLFASADAAYLVQLTYGDYVQGELVDLGWVLSAVLFGIAAFTQSSGTDTSGPPRRWGSNMQTLVPAVLIPAAAVALVLDADGALGPEARMAGLCAVTLSGVRLFVAVREQRLLTDELREARIDALTGLPNLRGLRSLPKRSLDGSVLLALDLEGLGDINATLGTAFGDRVLIGVSDRIALAMRNDDLLARIDGDEFGVLLRRASTHTGARVAEMLVSEIEAEMHLDGHTIRVSACVGVSSVSAGAGFDVLLLEAQEALHEAKRNGTGLVRSFAGAAGIQSQERLRLRAEIKAALRGDDPEIVPYFQPIVSLRDGSLVCVEALARWRHDGQILRPSAFMQEVEQSDSMRALTALMLESSLQQLRGAGIDTAVTVNVPADLVDDMLPHLVRGALSESASSPDQLIVEVTEEAIMRNAAAATQALDDLRGNGVKVWLDDFGTGWSGLSTLRDLAVDGLKIDGSFTRAMENDATTSKIVASVATLAAQLGVVVIYEGVEDPAQLRRLQLIGNGLVQGFAMAHPMAVEDLARWIASRSNPSAVSDAQVDRISAEIWE